MGAFIAGEVVLEVLNTVTTRARGARTVPTHNLLFMGRVLKQPQKIKFENAEIVVLELRTCRVSFMSRYQLNRWDIL